MKTRSILRITLVAILAIGGTFSVLAYGKNESEGRRMPFGRHGGMMSAQGVLDRFSGELGLTEEQKAQILPILEEKLPLMRERFKALKGSDRQAFQEEGQKIWQETETQVAEILTDEQMQKLREMKASRMGRGSRVGFTGKMGRFQGLMSELKLSEQQQEEIFAIFDTYRETRQKSLQNFQDVHTRMTDLLLQEEFDEQNVRELFQQQAPQWEERFVEHARMLSEMKKVLSPEQLETLQTKGADFIGTMLRRHGRGQ